MFYVYMRLAASRSQVVMMRYDAAISSQDPHLRMRGGTAVCCDLLQHLSKRVQQALLQLCAKVISKAKFSCIGNHKGTIDISCPRRWGRFPTTQKHHPDFVVSIYYAYLGFCMNTHGVKSACLRAREHAEDRCYVLSQTWMYFIEKHEIGDCEQGHE